MRQLHTHTSNVWAILEHPQSNIRIDPMFNYVSDDVIRLQRWLCGTGFTKILPPCVQSFLQISSPVRDKPRMHMARPLHCNWQAQVKPRVPPVYAFSSNVAEENFILVPFPSSRVKGESVNWCKILENGDSLGTLTWRKRNDSNSTH